MIKFFRKISRITSYNVCYTKLLRDSLLAFTFYRPTFNNTQGTIELLFSSGRINMIENDSIREFLIAWPGNIEDMTEEEVYAMTVFEESYYPLLSKYSYNFV